jgi:hypothetical protein
VFFERQDDQRFFPAILTLIVIHGHEVRQFSFVGSMTLRVL